MILSALTEPTSPIPQDTLFKRYDINTVYRKPSRNGFQPIELIRGEFDIVGVDPVVAECECLSLVSEVITDFEQDIEWVRICINHRALFDFIMDVADISSAQSPLVARALLDASYAPSTSSRIERWDVLRKSLLSCGAGLSDKQFNILGRWYRTSTGSITDAMVAIGEEVDEDSKFYSGYFEVSKLVAFLDTSLGAHYRENEIMLDFCFPPPSDDNDGLYFRVEVAYTNQPDVGEAIAVGGRVDSSLRKHVNTSSYRMVSMTWNLSKLMMNVTVSTAGLLGSPDALVCAQRDSRNDDPATIDMNAEQLSVSLEIRKMGLSSDIFYGSASLQEQLEFALARGVRYMVIIREKDLTIQLTDGTREKVNDYIVSMRVLTGGKTKQVREITMRKSELKNHLAHRTY
jgi:histidyl-tRNA synthetase